MNNHVLEMGCRDFYKITDIPFSKKEDEEITQMEKELKGSAREFFELMVEGYIDQEYRQETNYQLLLNCLKLLNENMELYSELFRLQKLSLQCG